MDISGEPPSAWSGVFPDFRTAVPGRVEALELLAPAPWLLDPPPAGWRDPADWVVLRDLTVVDDGWADIAAEPATWFDPAVGAAFDLPAPGRLAAGTRLRLVERGRVIDTLRGGWFAALTLVDPNRDRRILVRLTDVADEGAWRPTVSWIAAGACILPLATADPATADDLVAALELSARAAWLRWGAAHGIADLGAARAAHVARAAAARPAARQTLIDEVKRFAALARSETDEEAARRRLADEQWLRAALDRRDRRDD